MLVEQELQFSGGFVGPPTPRTKTAPGVPDMQNLCLTPEGTSLRPFPGFRRTYPYNLEYTAYVTLLESTGAYSWRASQADATTAVDAGSVQISESYLIVSFPAQAFETTGGRGIAIVDQVTSRIVAMAFHPGGIELDAINDAAVEGDRYPVVIGHLNRQSAHDYPQLIHFDGLTWIVTPWEEVYVFDGVSCRRAGIRPPQIPPTAQLTGDTEGSTYVIEGDPRVSAYYGVNPAGADNDWTAASDRDSSHITFSDNTESIKITIDEEERQTGLVAQRNLQTTVQKEVPAGTNAVELWVKFDGDSVNGVLNTGSDSQASTVIYIVGPTPAITFYASNEEVSDLTDADVDITSHTAHLAHEIKQILEPGRWYKFQIPWPIATAYTLKSMGFGLSCAIPEQCFATTGSVSYSFRIKYIGTASEVVATLPEGEYALAFTWYDSERDRESALSPMIGPVELPADQAIKIDITGWWSDTENEESELAGFWNGNPDELHVDKVRVYLAPMDWGTDEFGRPFFRLLTEQDIPEADAGNFNRRWVTFKGEVDMERLLVQSPPPYYNYPLSGTDWVLPDGDRLLFGNVRDYAVGRGTMPYSTFIKKTKAWVNDADSDDVVWSESDPSSLTFSASANVGEYDEITRHWENGADSTHIVYAVADPSSKDFTRDTTHEPSWGPWLEGREIRIGTMADTFMIAKAIKDTGSYGVGSVTFSALQTAGDKITIGETDVYEFDGIGEDNINVEIEAGDLNTTLTNLATAMNASGTVAVTGTTDFDGKQLRITNDAVGTTTVDVAATVDDGSVMTVVDVSGGAAATNEYDHLWFYKHDGKYSGYSGRITDENETANDLLMDYEILGYPTRVYWTTLTTWGRYPEGRALGGYFEADLPGDEIMALGHVGDLVLVLGRRTHEFRRQDKAMMDDELGNPFPRSRTDMGGCVSGRSLVQLPNNTAMFLSPEGKLMVATPEGVQIHPISERVGGYMSSQYRISQNHLRFAHAVWLPEHQWYVLFLNDSGDPDSTDKFAEWPDAAAEDEHVEWV